MRKHYFLLLLILIPIIGAIVCSIAGEYTKKEKGKKAWIFLGSIGVIVIEAIMLITQLVSSTKQEFFVSYPSLCGFGLSFQLDGFRILYTFITIGAWLITTIFSVDYFKQKEKGSMKQSIYTFFLLFTLGNTIGIFLAADFFTFFIFFEMMSLTSYLWVAYRNTEQAKQASQTYLFVAVGCGLVQLFGIFLLFFVTKTLQFSSLIDAANSAMQTSSNRVLLFISGVCMLVGFGAKAGCVPVHFWMQDSYEQAPAPATALLSSILSKTGLLGILAISSTIFIQNSDWGMLLVIVGVFTMVIGAVLALFSIDLKRTLAASSMSQIGFILVGIGMQGLLGIENEIAVRGTILYMMNHSIMKLVLFIIAGIIFMNIGKLDLNEIRGFGKDKPVLNFSFLMASLGVGGIPFWSGYISKTLVHESIVEYAEKLTGSTLYFMKGIEWIFLITGGFTVAYMLKLYIAIFIEENKNQRKMKQLNGRYMNQASTIVLCVCSVLIFIFGILPKLFMDSIADFSEKSFLLQSKKLEIVHYFSLVNLAGAAISIAIGILVYVILIRKIVRRKLQSGEVVYIDVWPSWLSIEKIIVKPLFLCFFPFLFSIICRGLDQCADVIIIILRKTIYSDVKKKKPLPEGTKFTYILGTIFDDIVIFLNKTILRKKPIKRSFVHTFAVKKAEIDATNPFIVGSLSFGLMMVCIGLCLTLLYMLLFK